MNTRQLRLTTIARLLTLLLTITASFRMHAQQLELTDADNNPVVFATILNEDGRFLGYSDLNGRLPDLQQSRRLFISHVAYEPADIDVQTLTGTTIVMKEANIGLDEVKVSPKPIIRMRKFYRLYFWKDDKVYYFRTGITDYYYNKQTRKTTSRKLASEHHSRAPFGLLNLLPWSKAFEREDTTAYDRLLSGKNNRRMVPVDVLRSRIVMKDSITGFVVKDTLRQQLRIVDDPSKWPTKETTSKKKDKKKKDSDKEKDEDRYAMTNRQSKSIVAYHYDGTENPRGEDLIYRTFFAKYGGHDNKKEKDIQLEFSLTDYTIELEYLTEKEAKERMKEKFPKMGRKEIDALARQKGIPTLSNKTATLLDQMK